MDKLFKFLMYVAAIALVYVGQTFFKVKQTRRAGTFDKKILLDGIVDHLLYFAGVMAIFASGLVLPEVKIATINGIDVNMVDALCVMAIALYAKQGYAALNNIKDEYEVDNVKIQAVDFNLASDYEEKAKTIKG